ncbi:MAG: Signal peptidase I T [Parcubacteria group bacterium ADurb.Bin326]|nr:MAG: Signal peptidase I T [Parcubacteria group bacterium ADurb.Bin326]
MPESNNNEKYYLSGSERPFWQKASEFIWEMVRVAVISLAIIIPVRYFLIQPFYVKGASMEPNFYDHEYLIIDEISYRFNQPQRGDIVVFKYPKDPKQFFIKRVVGLPGERVKIEDNKIYIDGTILNEAYLDSGAETVLALRGYGDVVLGSDEYFLLGDNRSQSLDSRSFGPVKREYIIGRTWLRGWPFNRVTFFSAPEYK